MSTGQATTRAYDRDREIRRQILTVRTWDGARWRTTQEWLDTIVPAPGFGGYDRRGRQWEFPNRAATGNELRRMQDEGLVERRVNPDDGRSVQYRVAPHVGT